MTKIADKFHIEELAHPLYIEQFGAHKVAKYARVYWGEMVTGIEHLREWLDSPIIVNNYHYDADYKAGGWEAIKDRKDLFINSGVRHLGARFGRTFSGHYFGLCLDVKQDKYTPKILQEMIVQNAQDFLNIVRMENADVTKTWLHVQFGQRFRNVPIGVYNP